MTALNAPGSQRDEDTFLRWTRRSKPGGLGRQVSPPGKCRQATSQQAGAEAAPRRGGGWCPRPSGSCGLRPAAWAEGAEHTAFQGLPSGLPAVRGSQEAEAALGARGAGRCGRCGTAGTQAPRLRASCPSAVQVRTQVQPPKQLTDPGRAWACGPWGRSRCASRGRAVGLSHEALISGKPQRRQPGALPPQAG